MSANFTGVTFAKQKVTPSYDGIVRRALLTDGTLTGCEMSYSGSTLTMSAGQLLLCGRQIVHPSSQNWAVTEQTSGYARLVLTIDLTRTSTKETFDQVVDTIQYATSVDGFAALEQTDINTTGTKYQVAACVVSLGTGGITGIVSKLEKCEGGGAGLNFKVVGGTTAPGSPTENTIWVNTNTAISGYTISGIAAPGWAMPSGWVYINAGIGKASGSPEFNALKKNEILIKPASVKQYVGGQWVDKKAKIYQGGVWVDWTTFFYKDGDECSTLTGGWEIDKTSDGTITKNADSITFNLKGIVGYNTYGIANTVDPIDLTAFATLRINSGWLRSTSGTIEERVFPRFGVARTKPRSYAEIKSLDAYISDGQALDVSNFTGKYYIFVCVAFDGSNNYTAEIELTEVSS